MKSADLYGVVGDRYGELWMMLCSQEEGSAI